MQYIFKITKCENCSRRELRETLFGLQLSCACVACKKKILPRK